MKDVRQRIWRFPRRGQVGDNFHLGVVRDKARKYQTVNVLRVRVGPDSWVEIGGRRFDHKIHRAGCSGTLRGIAAHSRPYGHKGRDKNLPESPRSPANTLHSHRASNPSARGHAPAFLELPDVLLPSPTEDYLRAREMLRRPESRKQKPLLLRSRRLIPMRT